MALESVDVTTDVTVDVTVDVSIGSVAVGCGCSGGVQACAARDFCCDCS